ncbi:MAG: hypothetical protein F4X83_08955, partial [Chloroflexi bacterium]|nr:hypothetical protein [Chloroflexota bacterium]
MPDVLFLVKTRGGATIPRAAMLAAYPNGTYRTGQTDTDGKCQLDLYRIDKEMKVLVAAEGHLPYHTDLIPGESNVVPLELDPSKDDKKALLFTRDTGYIPGIEGRLNPHKDGYVYAENIAINGRLATPAAHFQIGECLHLIDVFGVSST